MPSCPAEHPALPGGLTRRSALGSRPRPPAPAPRDLGTHRHNGRDLEQWEYEVTSGGRIRYVIDDQHRTVWLIYASPRHPKDTDR
jgi:hypothetical protein